LKSEKKYQTKQKKVFFKKVKKRLDDLKKF